MTAPLVGSLSIIILILLVGIVLFLCFTPHTAREGALGERDHQHHQYLPAGHSYLYYRDRNGYLQYEEDGCRDCLETRANDLKRQGLDVTECVLGTKRSNYV